jgi:GNAT superfamily N-acetyltransferase
MSVDLQENDFDFSQSEQLLSNIGMGIKRLDHQDQQAYYQWVLGTWGEGWTAESSNGLKNDPVTTFFIVDTHKAIRGFASYDVTMFRGSFGPTGVDKELRGLGIGKALLLRCLLDMKHRGYPRCEIGWVGPISFYAHTVDAKICATFVQGSKKL